LDADNGWFIAMAAAEMADGAVTREGLNDNAVLAIHDERCLRETLATLHQCVEKPRFTSYLTELHRERFALLPPRRDFVSQILMMASVASYQVSNIPFRRFADAWAAGARQCAEKGDEAGFKQIIADWHAFVAISSKKSGALVDLLISQVIMLGPARHFRNAAQSLGLQDEASYFQRLVDYSKA
jgi:hypothetical protein